MKKKRILITGLGFITSIGNDQSTVLSSLQKMEHGLELFPPFNHPNIPISLLGTLKNFNTESEDPEDWVGPKHINIRQEIKRGLAPHGFYAFYALEEALKDSKLDMHDNLISNTKTGLYTASCGSPLYIYKNLKRLYEKGVMRCKPLGIVRSIVGTLTFNLTAAYKILGTSAGFVSACASSGHALGYAFEEIKSGRQDRMFVVGGEDCLLETILPFAGMRVLSTEQDPKKAARPFDQNRNGFVGTGGSVALLLEEEQSALQRNAKIYSEFLGWGQATDGYHPVKPHPEGRGLYNAMNIALDNSKISINDVDYINTHATGTKPGDLAEITALKNIYLNKKTSNNFNFPSLSSTKALTGHGLSLASIMEAAFCNLSLYHNFMPGSAHITNLDKEAHDLNILQETKYKNINIALSNSSGFGGANVVLIFKKYGS